MIYRYTHLPGVRPEDIAFLEKYKKDLMTLVKHNSCLVYFDRDQVMEYHVEGQTVRIDDAVSDHLSIPIDKGFYSPTLFFDTIKYYFSTVRLANPIQYTITCEETGKISFTLNIPDHAWLEAGTEELKECFHRKDANGVIEYSFKKGDAWSFIAKSSDLFLSTNDVRWYMSKMLDLIHAFEKESWNGNRYYELKAIAERDNIVLYFTKTLTLYCYLMDKKIRISDSAHENMVVSLLKDHHQPLVVTVPKGFYTPYTLCYTLNNHLPLRDLYWFEASNDYQRYTIKVHMMSNASIHFGPGWDAPFRAHLYPHLRELLKEGLRQGSVISFPAITCRKYDGVSQFPFKNVDLSRVRQIRKRATESSIEEYMSDMFHGTKQKKIRYGNKLMRKNLDTGFQKNKKSMFYFTPGMRIKVRHIKHRPLQNIRIPFDEGKNFFTCIPTPWSIAIRRVFWVSNKLSSYIPFTLSPSHKDSTRYRL